MNYPTTLQELGHHIGQQDLQDLVCNFIFYQENPRETPLPPAQTIQWLTAGVSHLLVFHSATTIFRAPNNPSGTGGMYRETIHSTLKRKSGGTITPHHNCIFTDNGSDEPGVKGLDVAWVYLFFSFEIEGKSYPCALIHNFHRTFTEPDPDNGLWVVEPEYNQNRSHFMSVVHADSIVQAAHLLPIFGGTSALPPKRQFTHTLDSFHGFYVNKYIDYHAFEMVF